MVMLAVCFATATLLVCFIYFATDWYAKHLVNTWSDGTKTARLNRIKAIAKDNKSNEELNDN